MKTQDFKRDVLHAIDTLNLEQTSQVMNFIMAMKSKPQPDRTTQFRIHAMQQIREALASESTEPVYEMNMA